MKGGSHVDRHNRVGILFYTTGMSRAEKSNVFKVSSFP